MVPMRKRSDVMQAVKQFAKAIGAPEVIICDAAAEQMSAAVRKFCNEIGTTLRILEKGTQWANKAELYPEVNNSLDDHYFKLIIYLFDKDFRVHHRLLKSVKNFCQKHVGLIRCES